jgi:hypothetical protein
VDKAGFLFFILMCFNVKTKGKDLPIIEYKKHYDIPAYYFNGETERK